MEQIGKAGLIVSSYLTNLFIGSLCALALISNAYGQSPPDNFAQHRSTENIEKRIGRLRASLPDDHETLSSPSSVASQAETCFTIDKVVVDGAKTISNRAIKRLSKSYSGKCVGIMQIQQILRALTNIYLKEGYLTARIYIPEQEIKNTRELRFVVEEGIVSDIYYNGHTTGGSNRHILTALPHIKGKILNLREIEQGLDQLNRLRSNHATIEILPGSKENTSVVNVVNHKEKGWQASISHDNMGQASTGYARYDFNLTIDDMLRLNDLWTFRYLKTGKDYWNASRLAASSNAYIASLSVPYGYWTFDFGGYFYTYNSQIAAKFPNIMTSGSSSELYMSTSRILHRDNNSLTNVNAGFTQGKINNFIQGSKVAIGSRNYSNINLDLSYSKRTSIGYWVVYFSYVRGHNQLPDIKKSNLSGFDADLDFSKLVATFNLVNEFNLLNYNFRITNLLVGQYSSDRLFGNEQISLGGFNSVRGAREGVFYGNTGFFMRNEIVAKSTIQRENHGSDQHTDKLHPYAAIDYGAVDQPDEPKKKSAQIASWTIGVRLIGKTLHIDTGYSNIFFVTEKHKRNGLVFVHLSATL